MPPTIRLFAFPALMALGPSPHWLVLYWEEATQPKMKKLDCVEDSAATLTDRVAARDIGIKYGRRKDYAKGLEFLKRAVILGWDQPKNPLPGVKQSGLDASRKDGSLRRFLDDPLKDE